MSAPLASGLWHRLSLPLRVLKARPRLLISVVCGAVTAFLLPEPLKHAARLLIGWNVGVFLYFVLAWTMMVASDDASMRQRADNLDEGRFAILILSTLASAAAFGAIVAELGTVKDLSGNAKEYHILLAAMTIVSAWAFIHLMFALHYAHEYFVEREQKGAKPPKAAGGLIFPAQPKPGYIEFLYFSYIIGVACQTADVEISSREMRIIAVLHGVLAFFFNSAVLALTINIAAGLI